jgi:tetratricopeptide (TPR) repeat protein
MLAGLKTIAVTGAVCLVLLHGSRCWGGQIGKVGMLLSQGRPEAALALLDSIIAANPDNVDAYSSRAFVNLKMVRYQQAIADFSSVIRLQPDDPDCWLSRGMVYDQLHDRERAEADYRKACELGDKSGCSFLEQMSGRSGK